MAVAWESFAGSYRASCITPPHLAVGRSPMSSNSEPVHLNNRHRDTLLQIFQHPTGHNIQWEAVVSLLEAVGTVDTRHDGKYLISVGGESEVITRPRSKDI